MAEHFLTHLSQALYSFFSRSLKVNTERSEYADAGMNHREGGWPKDVDPNEVEQTMRYRKKVEKDENFAVSVVALGEVSTEGD